MKNLLVSSKKLFFIFCFGLYIFFWLLIILLEGVVSIYIKEIANSLAISFNLVVNLIILAISPLLFFCLVHYFFQKKNKIIKFFILLVFGSLVIIFYIAYLFLLLYHLRGGFSFDWSFFWFNRSEAFLTVVRVLPQAGKIAFIILVIFIFLVFFTTFSKVYFYFRTKKSVLKFISVIFVVSIFFLVFSPKVLRGEMVTFFEKNFLPDNEVEIFYGQKYNQYLSKQYLNPPIIPTEVDASILGDRIFFVHLESVNSFLISDDITPNLMRISQKGIFFPEFYGSSVQTLRGQESILCGLPPALANTLMDQVGPEKIKQLFCLPKILKTLGYKTLFFKDDNLEFSHTGDFMLSIGFDEVHNYDIMQPNDPELGWGFREDIFYQRVLEYLQKNYQDQKVFVYIATSATNHIPFKINDQKYQSLVPFTQPKNFKEKITNTTFIQDAYLGYFFDLLDKNYLINSSFFIFSDHSWPIGIHPNNIFNERGHYEENFLTFLTFIPPKDKTDFYQPSKIVKTRYSQMDILPTIFDILGIKKDDFLGNSFISEISKQPFDFKFKKNLIISVQPYSGGFISVIDFPTKYLFDIYQRQIWSFDLLTDPLENQPKLLSNPKNYFYLIDNFFNH